MRILTNNQSWPLTSLFYQIGRYFSFATWFFKDAFIRYRVRLVLLGVANIVGVGLQSLAILIAYRYASAVEGGKVLDFAGLTIDARQSLHLLVATATAVFVLSAASAVLVMRARVAGAALALDYAQFCAERVYYLLSRMLVLPRSDLLRDWSPDRFAELTRRDARYCGQVLRIASYGLLHVGTVTVAAVALLVLDVYLTLVVFAILAVSVLFLRRTSIRGASHRARLQQHTAEASRDRRTLEDWVLRRPVAIDFPEGGIRSEAKPPSATKVREATLGQRHALEAGKLIAQIAVGCALFVVLVVHGGATLSQASNWSSLVAYIAVLTLFGASMARVGRMLVNMNRFYPPLARHGRFIRAIEDDLRAADVRKPAGSYQLDAPALTAEQSGHVDMRPGSRIGLVVSMVNRFSMMTLAGSLRPLIGERADAPSAVPWFVVWGVDMAEGSWRASLGLGPDCRASDLRTALASLPEQPTPVDVPDNLDQAIPDDEQKRLSPAAVFTLMALSAVINRRPILVLEHVGLTQLPPMLRAALLDKASGCITLIAYRPDASEQPGSHGEGAVIISDEDQVFGWAPTAVFLAGNKMIAEAINKIVRIRKGREIGASIDEDLDEMD